MFTESAAKDNECEILFMESIQQFSTVYREAHHVVVEEIYVLIKSNYAIISIVFYHHMFDFNNLLVIIKFTIPKKVQNAHTNKDWVQMLLTLSLAK